MKKLIIIIIIIGALVLLYFTQDTPVIKSNGAPSSNAGETFRPDPSGATFIFDDGAVTLSGGRNERTLAPGGALVEETELLDIFAYGDINNDGRDDTTLFLVRYGAGSGTFIYVAAFVSGPVTYRGSRVFFLGDRIAPQSLTIDNKGVVTVEYLDRGPDEPFASEPTILRTRQFVFRAGEFQER